MALLFVSVSLLGTLWIYQEYKALEEQAAGIRKSFVQEQNLKLKVEVEKAISYINYHRVIARERVKKDLKERAEQARKLAGDVLKHYNGKLPDLYIKNMITDTMRSMRFMGGLGYYFVVDSNGTVVLHPGIPGLEGKNLWDWRDAEGHYTVRDMVDLVQEKGEGFYRYLWAKPGSNLHEYEKVAYLISFKPFNWLIGVGEYLTESIERSKKNALEGLVRLVVDGKSYVFAGTWDGLSLLGPAVGKNVWDVTDANGKKVVQSLVAKAKAGGGFVEYMMPPIDGHAPRRKVSYVRGIPQWKWYVGAGYQVGDVETVIAKREAALKAKVRDKLVNITILLLISLATLMGLAKLLSLRVGREFNVFKNFFQKAATELEPIDLGRLENREFRELAKAANVMVGERSRLEKEKTAHGAPAFAIAKDGGPGYPGRRHSP